MQLHSVHLHQRPNKRSHRLSSTPGHLSGASEENASLSSAPHDAVNDDDVNDDDHSKDVCPFDPREFSPPPTRARRTKHRNYLWIHILMQFPIHVRLQGEAIHVSTFNIHLGESVSCIFEGNLM